MLMSLLSIERSLDTERLMIRIQDTINIPMIAEQKWHIIDAKMASMLRFGSWSYVSSEGRGEGREVG